MYEYTSICSINIPHIDVFILDYSGLLLNLFAWEIRYIIKPDRIFFNRNDFYVFSKGLRSLIDIVG